MRITEKARVLSTSDGRAEVALAGGDDPAKCTACAMASRCAAREHRLTARAPEGVRPGDEVTVELDLPSPAWAAFLLFMMPLAAAFLVGGVTFGLTRSEALGLLGGAAGGAAAYLALYLTRVGSKGGASIVGTPGPSDDGGGQPGRSA